MSALWERTLIYLGLKEEPDPILDVLPESDPTGPIATGGPVYRELDPTGGENPGGSNVRRLRGAEVSIATAGAQGRVAVVDVNVFDDVEAIGARYRGRQVVLFDLRGAPAATARRALDFVSGLTYALRGRLRRVDDRVFLLEPEGVGVSVQERERLARLGFELPLESRSVAGDGGDGPVL